MYPSLMFGNNSLGTRQGGSAYMRAYEMKLIHDLHSTKVQSNGGEPFAASCWQRQSDQLESSRTVLSGISILKMRFVKPLPLSSTQKLEQHQRFHLA